MRIRRTPFRPLTAAFTVLLVSLSWATSLLSTFAGKIVRVTVEQK